MKTLSKKILTGCLAVCMAGLCACSPSVGSSAKPDADVTTDRGPTATETALPTEQPTEEPHKGSAALSLLQSGYPLGTPSDSGYYYLQYRDDAALNICYIDYASNQQLVLCSQPNCLHDSDACAAWVPYAGSTAGVYAINEKLCLIHYGSLTTTDYKLFGKDAAPSIEIRNADGTNATTLLQLPANTYFSGLFATDGDFLYGMLKELQTSENRKVNVATKLVKISLQDGSLETIREMTQMDPSIVGASGHTLALSYYQTDPTGEDALPTTRFYESYDTTTGTVTPLCSVSLSEGTCICVGDELLSLDRATHEVTSYSLQTGEKQVLYTLPLDDYSDAYCSYALPDSVMLLLYPNDADSGVVHALLSVDTGELVNITQLMDSDETSGGKTRKVEIAAEYEENFLILSGIRYQTAVFKTGENESIGLPTESYEFSTISRDDFLNHTNAFNRITNLNDS